MTAKTFFTHFFKNTPIAIYERAKILSSYRRHIFKYWGVVVGSSFIVFSLLTLPNRRSVAAIELKGGNENGLLSNPLYPVSSCLPNRKRPLGN